jgi:hypothetical protein
MQGIPWWMVPPMVVASAIEDLKTKWFLWRCKKKTHEEIYQENLHPPKDKSRGPFTP